MRKSLYTLTLAVALGGTTPALADEATLAALQGVDIDLSDTLTQQVESAESDEAIAEAVAAVVAANQDEAGAIVAAALSAQPELDDEIVNAALGAAPGASDAIQQAAASLGSTPAGVTTTTDDAGTPPGGHGGAASPN